MQPESAQMTLDDAVLQQRCRKALHLCVVPISWEESVVQFFFASRRTQRMVVVRSCVLCLGFGVQHGRVGLAGCPR